MITPVEIRRKIERWYLSFLEHWLRGESFFPRDIAAGSPPSTFIALREAVETLHRSAKIQRGYGYTIVSEFRHTRQQGDQDIPVRIVIETQQDFLRLLEKETEFEQFCQDVALIRMQLPQLNDWMLHTPRTIIDKHSVWQDLILVCAYFLEHPRPQLYIRQLPIPVHTKFIEQHRTVLQDLLKNLLPPDAIDANASTFEQRFGLREDEVRIRIRLLDQQLQKRFQLPLDDVTLLLSQLAHLNLTGQCCLITENKMNFRNYSGG